jgi:hypothetical protein
MRQVHVGTIAMPPTRRAVETWRVGKGALHAPGELSAISSDQVHRLDRRQARKCETAKVAALQARSSPSPRYAAGFPSLCAAHRSGA